MYTFSRFQKVFFKSMIMDDILSLVKRRDWQEVITRSRHVSPSEMLKRDSSSFNQTCLHIALTLDPPVEVVENLLRFADGHQAAQMKEDRNGYLPLHCAIRYRSSFEGINLLVNTYKEGVSIRDKNQMSSIHLASYFNSDTKVVDLLLKTDPLLARMKTKQNASPLHIACRRGANGNIVKSLLKFHPGAVKENMRGQWSPLHLAIWHEASDKVLIDLISACPEAAKVKTSSSNQTPLSLYWSNRTISKEVVSILLGGGSGCGLIHSVLKLPQRIPNLLTYVLEEFDDNAKSFDEKGRLPLHVAIESKRLVRTGEWKKIFQRNPDAIFHCDKRTSSYPFMTASSKSDLNLTFELIRLAPDIFEHLGVS